MRYIKFTISLIVCIIAVVVMLSESDTYPIGFFAEKAICLAVAFFCARIIVKTNIIRLED